MRRSLTVFCVVLCLTLSLTFQVKAKNPEKDSLPKTVAELEKAILQVLNETHTPGVGAAIVAREGPRWIAGIGIADVAARRPVTPDTLFRIGSVSKSFVALAVLKLQREKKLDLNGPVRMLAPEIQFANAWESTDPVRVVHLLEHTAGFDDLHLPEYANCDPKPLTLREGLDLHPHSRIARWRPGTRFSYANSGPAVAAYLVQKITGKPFEEYVRENFFLPLQMPTATYFLPRDEGIITKLYRGDGRTPYPYWHIAVRPAGSINASVREMANYVEMYLNRGSFRGVTILPSDELDRMEVPATTYAARAGLKKGYGLNNYSQQDEGFVYHGHNGGVAGGLTAMAYMQDQGIGYVFMINSGNGQAFQKIEKLIRGFATRGLQKAFLPAAAPVPPPIAQQYSGYFEPISPRQEIGHFLEPILGLQKAIVIASGLVLKPVIGKREVFVAVSDHLFRKEKDPLPSIALIADHSEGTLIQSTSTFRRIPTWLAWAEICATAAIALLVVSTVLFALVWIPRKLLGRRGAVRHLGIRIWPLISILCLGAAALLMIVSSDDWDAITRFGAVTPWSSGVFLLTIAFALAAVIGLVAVLRVHRCEVQRWVYIHSLASSIALVVLALYLAYWGVVGVRTWT